MSLFEFLQQAYVLPFHLALVVAGASMLVGTLGDVGDGDISWAVWWKSARSFVPLSLRVIATSLAFGLTGLLAASLVGAPLGLFTALISYGVALGAAALTLLLLEIMFRMLFAGTEPEGQTPVDLVGCTGVTTSTVSRFAGQASITVGERTVSAIVAVDVHGVVCVPSPEIPPGVDIYVTGCSPDKTVWYVTRY